jgi:DNA-binding Lrp family transcriptional regulator
MPKRSRKQIDEDEKKVIHELQKNSKESIDKIAKKCGFSRQKVWRIIKRLEKNKTVWGYHAVVDAEKINMRNYVMLVKRTNMPAEHLIDQMIKDFKSESMKKIGIDVHCNFYVHGCFDWMVMFSAADIKDAKKFAEHVNNAYAGAIGEVHILETIFPAKACGVVNPNIEELREYF